MKTIIKLTLLSSLLAPLTTNALSADKLYLSLSGGVTKARDWIFHGTTGDLAGNGGGIGIETKLGAQLGAGLGYTVNDHWRGELALDYLYSKLKGVSYSDAVSVMNGRNGFSQAYTLLAKAYRDFYWRDTGLKPYLSIGFGTARLSSPNRADMDDGGVPAADQTFKAKYTYAYSAGAGIRYDYSPKVGISAQYDYVATGKPTFLLYVNRTPGQLLPAKGRYETNIFRLNLTYRFGVPSESA